MQLTYQSQLRSESDPAVIANLQRKGWVETLPPDYDAATQHAPEWVNGAWVVRDKTPEEIAAETARLYPDAPMWQVKVWMVRNGIDLASIPGIMAASIPAGPQLQEALVRWETAPLVPYDNALVGLIAGALNISKETAWNEIRAI